MARLRADRGNSRRRAALVESLESRVLLAAQIFVTNNNGSTISQYDTAGTSINPSLLSGLSGNTYVYLAVSGSDLFVSNFYAGTIGEYTTAGATINANLVTGLSGSGLGPFGIAVSGSELFVANGDGGAPGTSSTVGEYTLGSTPGTIASSNPALITGLGDPGDVIVSGSDLFVSDYADDTIGEYTLTGTPVNPTLVSGLDQPQAIAISGSNIFVTSYTADTIGEYTTSGMQVNPALVSGLSGPIGIAVSGSDLFVVNAGNGTVGEYTTSGTQVNPSLISGLVGTLQLAVVGTSTNLAISQQPVSTTTTGTIGPISVEIDDSSGNLLTSDNSNVTLTIASGPTGAALGGTTTVAAVAGVATFSGLSISTAGTYTLTASDGSDTPATSSSFTISAPAETIGGLDLSFGTSGLASNSVGFASTNGVAQDGTQSVIIGTIGAAPDESFGVTRYNADGSLDTSFGTGGVTMTTFGSTDDVPTAVDVLSNGQILVAGTATTYTSGVASGSEYAVAEFNSNGTLNTSFGGGTGEVLISLSKTSGTLSNDVLNTIAVGSGGVIYLGGSSDAGVDNGTDFALAALNANGSVDSGFGGNGDVLLDFAVGDDVINSLALQPDGDIVAAGSATIGGVAEIALARFLPTGASDKHFGTNGMVTTNVRGVYDSASSVLIEPKGQIVIGGFSATGSGSSLSTDFVVARFTSAGRIDKSFGGGPVITSFGQPSAITQLVLQSNGQIIASGKTTPSLASFVPDELDVAVARYNTNGTLDTTFNGTGKAIVDLSSGVVADALRAAMFSDMMIEPLDASSLGAQFAAFVSSAQGVASVTTGGELIDAGNSGSNTVEAEIITAGVDIATTLLSSPPAAVTGGAKATASVSIAEDGNTQATGTVTIELQVATDAQGDGATTIKSVAEKISLRENQSHSYRIAFVYPQSLTAGSYYLLADVNTGSALQDLNPAKALSASSHTVDIAPPFISLSGSALSATSSFAVDKTAGVAFTLTNDGNVLAHGATTADLVLSTTQSAANGATVDTPKLSVGLTPGKSRPYRVSFKLPSSVTAGTYYLIAIIDPADSLGTLDHSSSMVVGAMQVVVG